MPVIASRPKWQCQSVWLLCIRGSYAQSVASTRWQALHQVAHMDARQVGHGPVHARELDAQVCLHLAGLPLPVARADQRRVTVKAMAITLRGLQRIGDEVGVMRRQGGGLHAAAPAGLDTP